MSAAFWRNNVTEPALAPLRRQIAELIPDGATIFDMGCGHGRLLLELAPRIDNGIGIDTDAAAIADATARAEQAGHRQLTFVEGEAGEMLRTLPMQPNVAIVSLTLHEMVNDKALDLIRRLSRISDRLIITDLLTAPGWLRRSVLGLGHAGRGEAYREYTGHGGVPGLLREAGIEDAVDRETAYPFIGLWIVDRHRH